MPYIITMHTDEAEHAVTTLDEAREAAVNLAITRYVEPDMRPSWADACRRLPVEGGTIGPLPNGRVIKVERTSWAELEV
jgi:hypothetical protein